MSALDKVITLTAQVCAFHPKTRPSADPYPLRVRGASERLGIYFTFSRISTTLCSVNSVNASKRMVSKQATESGLNILRAGSPGRRQAVLFIHGWACQAADYTALIDQISQQDDKLQYIAVDLPGHGASLTSLCNPPSVSGFATLLVELLRELRVEEVILVGHSMGCRIVLETWSQLQAKVGTSVGGVVFLDGSNYTLRTPASQNTSSESVFSKQKAEKAAVDVESMFSPSTPAAFRDTFTSHLRNLDQPFADALRKTHIAFDHERMSAALTEVGRQGTPFFSLQSTDCDEQNRRRPVRQGEETRWMRFLRDRIPQVEIVLVERAGHFPHVDQTDTVAKVMKVWVGDVLARDEGGKVIAAKV